MAKIKQATAAIMLAAVIGGAAIGASALPATADDAAGTASPSPAAAATDGYGGTGAGTPRGQHQANGKTEEILTGDTAAKVEAAVKAAQPGATIERMETDADGATYEAHLTKADGTRATVLLDDQFTVTATEGGGPGGAGH